MWPQLHMVARLRIEEQQRELTLLERRWRARDETDFVPSSNPRRPRMIAFALVAVLAVTSRVVLI